MESNQTTVALIGMTKKHRYLTEAWDHTGWLIKRGTNYRPQKTWTTQQGNESYNERNVDLNWLTLPSGGLAGKRPRHL